jgi:hypothetical protein
MRLFLLCIAATVPFASIATSACAQSTSPWVRVRPLPSALVTPALGASYVNVVFRGAAVYQKANWWTRLVERNRQAVLDVAVDATVNSAALRDTRVSSPVDIKNNDSQVDFGYSGTLVGRLPTTYSSMRVTVGISKTSQDGVDKLVTSIADLSKTSPALTVSQTTLGVVSAVKQVADFLFDKKLLEKKMSSVVDFPATGGAMPAGVYVCIAGDQSADYAKFFADSGAQLAWNGAQLTWKGDPVQKVSYFVVEITYDGKVFKTPLDALSMPRPWSALYELARREVGKITAATEVDKITSDIRAHLSDAQTLLDADPDYIQDERDKIHEAVRADTEQRLTNRVNRFSASAAGSGSSTTQSSSPTDSPAGSGKPIILSIPDNVGDRSIAKDIAKEQGARAAAVADSIRRALARPPR